MDFLELIKNRNYELKKIDNPHPDQKSIEELSKLDKNSNNQGAVLSQILQAVAERRSAMAPDDDDDDDVEEEDYYDDSSGWV